MKALFAKTIFLVATGSLATANPTLTLLERNADAERIDPNDHLSRQLTDEQAGERASTILLNPEWAGSVGDALWSRATLLDTRENPYLQRFEVAGMFHADGSSGQVRSDSEIERVDAINVRRARFGARLRAFHRVKLEAIADLEEGDADPDLLRLKADIDITPRHTLSVGKFRPNFGYEGSRDGHDLPTINRTTLGRTLLPSRALGATWTYDFGDWEATAGYFSGSTNGGIGSLDDSGYLYLGANGLLGGSASQRALYNRWHLAYIYNITPGNSDTIASGRSLSGATAFNGGALLTSPLFQHLVAGGIEVAQGRYGFNGDLMIGTGSSGTVYGVTLQPTYWLEPGLVQLVSRVHFAGSTELNTLTTGYGNGSSESFDSAPYATGDQLISLYLGANLHIYQDRFKLFTGFEYNNLSNSETGDRTESTIFHAGARLSF